jgi:hypothetical protein
VQKPHDLRSAAALKRDDFRPAVCRISAFKSRADRQNASETKPGAAVEALKESRVAQKKNSRRQEIAQFRHLSFL